VYLHGFTCDGYSYLCMPEMFYKEKKAKKKKGKKSKQDDDDDDDDVEYEPHPGLKVVLASAPMLRITAYDGEEIPSWYDYHTDHEGEMEDDFSPEELERLAQRLHAVLAREAEVLGDGRKVFLGGASQGCGVAVHTGLTYEGELGGLLGTMGHLLSCTPVTSEWLSKRVPVFAFNGLADTTMPWDKWVGPCWERLITAGATLEVVTEEGVDHGDDEREAAWIRSFLSAVMAKGSTKKDPKKKAGKKK